MKNPFSRKPVSSDVRPLALTAHHTEPGRTTTISNPDTRTPLPHSANRIDPHENADLYRVLVREKVAALAAAGGLDQDNLQALSHEIGSWLASWCQKVEQDAASRTEVAQLLLAQTVQDKTVCSAELASARTARAEVAAAREQVLKGWGFVAHVRADATAALAGAEPVIASRVLAVSHGDPSKTKTSDSDPRGRSADTGIAVPSMIGFPFAAATGVQTKNPAIDPEELSA